MTKNQKIILLSVAAIVAIAGAAIGATYLTRESMKSEEAQVAASKPVRANNHAYRHAQQANNIQPAAGKPACDDGNIVGTVIGGAAGGIAGNQIGKGTGKTVATLGGVAGGAYLGNQYINTRGATCN